MSDPMIMSRNPSLVPTQKNGESIAEVLEPSKTDAVIRIQAALRGKLDRKRVQVRLLS